MRQDMVHLVYCDNVAKNCPKFWPVKNDDNQGRIGTKIPHSRVFKDETLYFMEKGTKKSALKPELRTF